VGPEVQAGLEMAAAGLLLRAAVAPRQGVLFKRDAVQVGLAAEVLVEVRHRHRQMTLQSLLI